MARIERIRIAYSDPALRISLANIKNDPLKKSRNEDLSKHILNIVTLENLKHGNMVFKFDRSGFPTYLPKNSNNAGVDQILFSSRTEDVTTDASACSSYMLFCENMRLLAAAHVAGFHSQNPLFHREMLLYAYANLRKMAPEDPISAYISGMYFFAPSEFPHSQKAMINTNRTNLMSVVENLMSWDVRIKVIDIGGRYCRQIFSPKTGGYKLELMTFDAADVRSSSLIK